MTSQTQVERLLALVPYLLAHEGADLSEVAETFGVNPAQLRADLSVLYMCGLPGLLPGDLIEIDMDLVDGQGSIRLSNADYLARPLRFTRPEATGLILGLRSLREVAPADTIAVIDAALEKLRRAAGDLAADSDRVLLLVAGASEPVRRVIDEAIVGRRRLRLIYDGSNAARTAERLVDPESITLRDGYAYLEAFDVERDGWRSFRTDRIAAASITDEAAQSDRPRRGDDWAERLSSGRPVTLTLRPEAAWVGEYYPHEGLEPTADGVRIHVRVADPAWLQGLLLRLGPAVLAVDPPQYAESARAEAGRALAAYGEDATGPTVPGHARGGVESQT